jgi:TetR/AcrR family transcriptional regulator, repressor for uid operon
VSGKQMLDQPVASDDIALRVIDAARREFVQFGIKRANMESIARRAGVSRVTVYRRFPTKRQLLRAVVMADVAVFVPQFDRVLYGDGPIAERIADVTVLAVNELRSNPLLNSVLRADPDEVLPLFTVDGRAEFERYRDLLSTRIRALIKRDELGEHDPRRTAEVAMRLVYSVILLPFGVFPGASEAQIRAAAADFLVPILPSPHDGGETLRRRKRPRHH